MCSFGIRGAGRTPKGGSRRYKKMPRLRDFAARNLKKKERKAKSHLKVTTQNVALDKRIKKSSGATGIRRVNLVVIVVLEREGDPCTLK